MWTRAIAVRKHRVRESWLATTTDAVIRQMGDSVKSGTSQSVSVRPGGSGAVRRGTEAALRGVNAHREGANLLKRQGGEMS